MGGLSIYEGGGGSAGAKIDLGVPGLKYTKTKIVTRHSCKLV